MSRFKDLPQGINEQIAAHIKLYLQDPEKAHMWDSSIVGVPGPVRTLLLTTRGRKSGKSRHAALLYIEHDGAYLVVGSKGGLPKHPVWYLNLQAEPECEIRVASLHTKAVARTLEGEERDRVWKKFTDEQPVYLKYQARTERTLPLILLEPVKG